MTYGLCYVINDIVIVYNDVDWRLQLMQINLQYIALWMASNRLKLNPTKTDFMRCATHRRHHQLSRPLSFAGATVAPSLTVRNLGVVLDSEMSFAPHISQLVSRCFFQLRPAWRLYQLRRRKQQSTVLSLQGLTTVTVCLPVLHVINLTGCKRS